LLPSSDVTSRTQKGGAHMLRSLCMTAVLVLLAAAAGAPAGQASGIDRIKGKSFKDNETAVRPAALLNDCPYKVVVRIVARQNEADIQVKLDNRAYIKWTGPLSALSAADPWKMPDLRCPGLGADDSTVTFTRVRLRPLTDAEAPPAK